MEQPWFLGLVTANPLESVAWISRHGDRRVGGIVAAAMPENEAHCSNGGKSDHVEAGGGRP